MIDFIAAGTEGSAGSGNITPGAPASPQIGDIWIAAAHSSDQVAHALAGWNNIVQDNGGGTTSRLSVWWHRYAGSDPNRTVVHTGGQTPIGGIAAFRSVGIGVDITDNFDAYTIGNTLGSDGALGSGCWVGAWGGTSSKHVVQAAPAGGQGGNAMRDNSTTPNSARRNLAGITRGRISWLMRISVTNPNETQGLFAFSDAVSQRLDVRFGPTGNIEMRTVGGSGWTTVQAYSVDTWYRCAIEFDAITQAGNYRVRIDDGDWTAWTATELGFPTCNALVIACDATNAHEFWIDDIRIEQHDCPINTVGVLQGGTDASIEHAGITPSKNNCMLLAINGSADDNTRSPIPSGYTARFEDTGASTQNCFVSTAGNPDGSVALHTLLQTTAAATGTVTDTQAAADAWASVLIALEPGLAPILYRSPIQHLIMGGH